MMTESLLTLLQWLLPTGAVGSVIVWLTSKTLRQARTAQEVHNAYKAMYEDVQGTLIHLQNENIQIHSAMLRLEAAIRKATACRYYDTCPVRSELRKFPNREAFDQSQAGSHPKRQHGAAIPPAHDSHDELSENCGRYGIDGHPLIEPPLSFYLFCSLRSERPSSPRG